MKIPYILNHATCQQHASNMQLLSKIKELISAVFSEHTSCVMNKGIVSHALG